MRKLSISVLILCLVLGTAVVAMAKTTTKTAKGSVTAVDPVGNSLTVKGTAEWTFWVTATTKIEKGGKPIKLAEVKVGDNVTVWYTVNAAGKNEASKIVVHITKTPPKPAK